LSLARTRPVSWPGLLAFVGLRAKWSEIVVELESIVFGLLSRFEEAHPGQLPPSLIFYRDGVSEGEWEKVLDRELSAINAACDRMLVQHPTTLGANGWKPKASTRAISVL
jgi:hypothetical protein